MITQILWFVAGLASVIVVTLTTAFFPVPNSVIGRTLFELCPLVISGFIALLLWKKNKAFALGVGFWEIWYFLITFRVI